MGDVTGDGVVATVSTDGVVPAPAEPAPTGEPPAAPAYRSCQ